MCQNQSANIDRVLCLWYGLIKKKRRSFMFGGNSKPCMVFEYGCLQPTMNEDIAIEQIRLRNSFWNKLVEIEREHQAKVQSLLAIPGSEIPALQNELSELQEEIKSRRKAARKGNIDIDDLKDKIKEIKVRLVELWKNEKKLRKERIEIHKQDLKALDDERKKLVRAAQHKSGLYWTNYDDVLAIYNVARIKALKEGKELQFHRWTGEGKVAIRYQKGMPVNEVFENDTRLQINPVLEDAWYHPKRAVRRKLAQTAVRIRIGSDGRAPVWLELPMVMHRGLLENGEIRSAAVLRERVGSNFRWKLVVTVAIPEENLGLKRDCNSAIALDVGWRKVKDGVRTAYWVDNTGKEGQLILGSDIVSQFAKIDDLKSIRDNHFNDAKKILGAWVNNKAIPDWLKEDTKFIPQWRSAAKLVVMQKKWDKNRFSGDQEIFAYLQEWVKRDEHLWSWEVNLRDQIIRRRREVYRVFAAKIARDYKQIILEEFNLTKIKRKPNPEEGTQGSTPPNYYRTIASVSVLRNSLENAVRSRGSEVEYVDASYSTLTCQFCGHAENWDASKWVVNSCNKCGEIWDQDQNAAKVLLERGLSQKNAVSNQI
jgi:transposase